MEQPELLLPLIHYDAEAIIAPSRSISPQRTALLVSATRERMDKVHSGTHSIALFTWRGNEAKYTVLYSL